MQTLEAAFSANDDLRSYDVLLERIHQDTFAGRTPPAHPRAVIDASWQRLHRRGLRPDRRAVRHVDVRRESAQFARLRSLVPLATRHLSFLAEDDALVFVLADAESRIIHRASAGRLEDAAGELGFGVDADWSEDSVGTNGVGTAIATRRPVHVHGAEHYLLNQHEWSCAGAPIRDPRTGRPLGAITIAVDRPSAHPNILGLASLLAHTAHLELATEHHRQLHDLRTATWRLTRGVTGSWIVVDDWGWVAASHGQVPSTRVVLPTGLEEGRTWIAPLGDVSAQRVPGGWLLVASDSIAEPFGTGRLVVSENAAGAVVALSSARAGYEFDVSPRQADILRLLAARPDGSSAQDLSMALYGEAGHEVAVRAEISRLRKRLGDAIVSTPYRFAAALDVRVEPDDSGR